MKRSPLQNTVLLERVAHFAASSVQQAGKLAFVCKDWNETLQFYCTKMWQRVFTSHLIDKNRDPSAPSALYNLLCDEIIASKLSALVSPLCNCGTGPNDGGLLGTSALLSAASLGCLPILKELLERGAAISTERNFFNENVLHCAARSGSLECVTFLVERIFHVNCDHESSTISSSCSTRQARLCSDAPLLDVNEMTKHSHTPLYLAIAGNHTPVALFLIKQVKEVKVSNGRKSEPMTSTIHTAVRKNNVSILEAILERDPKMIEHTQIDGMTPLGAAVVAGSYECFVVLFRKFFTKSKKQEQEQAPNGDDDDEIIKRSLVLIAEYLRENMLDFVVEFLTSMMNRNDEVGDDGAGMTEKEISGKGNVEDSTSGKWSVDLARTIDDALQHKKVRTESDNGKKCRMISRIAKLKERRKNKEND